MCNAHPRQRRRPGGLAAALAVGLAVGLLPGALTAQDPGPPQVESVQFVGNQTLSDSRLRRAIQTRETGCRSVVLTPLCWVGVDFATDPYVLSRRALSDDIVRLLVLYFGSGYRDVVVDTTVVLDDLGQAAVRFTVAEGEPTVIDSIGFLGLQEVNDDAITAGLVTVRGAPLDIFGLDADRDTLLSRLHERGYAHADVLRSFFIPSNNPHLSRVTFDLYLGPVARFGAIDVTGAESVSPDLVRRLLPFREGTRYRRGLVIEAQRSLYSVDLFQSTAISQDLDHQPDSVIPIAVQVSEGDLHRVRFGGGGSTADCVNFEARWASRNFYGGARRFELIGGLSNILAEPLNSTACFQSGTGEFAKLNWRISSEFTQPWFISGRNSLTASLFLERQSLKDVFVRRAVGVTLRANHSLGQGAATSLAWRPQLAELDAAEIFFCTSFLVCAPNDIAILQGRNWLSPVAFTVGRDRTDHLLNPTRGSRSSIELESASNATGSDFGYDRAVLEAAWFRELAPGWILASRLRAGFLNARAFDELSGDLQGTEVVHPQVRFYAGGANTVRGFGQNQLGPRVLTLSVNRLVSEGCDPLTILDLSCNVESLEGIDVNTLLPQPTGGSGTVVGNMEVRFPLGGPAVQGSAFLDVGQVWEETDKAELRDLQWTPGLGVRYLSPIGPIRVDLGYRFNGAEPLSVVTTQLRPFDPTVDDDGDRVEGTDFVRAGELAVLENPVFFGAAGPWSLRRFQLHFSIGQAF